MIVAEKPRIDPGISGRDHKRIIQTELPVPAVSRKTHFVASDRVERVETGSEDNAVKLAQLFWSVFLVYRR